MVNASPVAQWPVLRQVSGHAIGPLSDSLPVCFWSIQLLQIFSIFITFILLIVSFLMDASNWEMTMLKSFQFIICTLRTEKRKSRN